MREKQVGRPKCDLWGDAYRELLRSGSVAIALASVILFVVAMTIFGPLGTLETLRPLPRFAYWAVSAAITFPFCYAVAAVTLYLTRRRSLIGIVPAVAAAVLLEGFICMVVVVSAHLVFIPHVPPPALVNTYLTVTVVVAVCTFFAHYVVFLRTSHGRAALAERSVPDGAAPPVRHDAAVAVRGSETVPASVTVEVGTSAPGDGAPSRGGNMRGAVPRSAGRAAGAGSPAARPAPQNRAHVPGRGGSEPGRLTAQQARFYRRLSRTVSRDIVYLRMDDHYVQVSSTDGSCLILMRFADAVVELGDLGMQVHRSYWVARRHMLAVVRREGRPMVRVTGGDHVPISRPYFPAVRDALHVEPA
ncbi:MAG: LytTR family DNA-binding domain-containing protein [Spirochaetaceae bacterium]|nr:LytTR family DNA-binding domain-containing protein [Spirochaetaceae bacterium]